MKWRNSKERELLANGGSRDQTLPNKNNPNPDLSDAKCDRAITPLSPNPPSPQNNSLSPPPSSHNSSVKDDLHNSLNLGTPNTAHSPQSSPLMHINNASTAAAVVAFSISGSAGMQMSSPPPLLAVAKSMANASDQSPLSISISNSVSASALCFATTTTTASTSASSSTASSPACASVGGIVGSNLPMTSADFQAKINAEMQKHLAAADIKFKLENSINEAKQRRLNLLSGNDLHAGQHANGLFIGTHISDALTSHLHGHGHHGQHTRLEHVHQMSAAHAHQQQQAFAHAHFMKPFFDEYEDSNSDTDEEISVT